MMTLCSTAQPWDELLVPIVFIFAIPFESNLMYAIVDIETTGGSGKLHKMTEIAIIQHDGQKECGRFESLINPGVPIPPSITRLTGITNEMVANAPMFHQIAKAIWEFTEGRVFVAHNVNFDYGFIHQHFLELGAKWAPKRLCTVRLSRKLMPGLSSYSLGRLATHMGQNIDGRHRAMGDCVFTTHLFEHLLRLDKEDHIGFALNARSRESALPPLVSREVLDRLPETMGIYTFLGAKGKILYIGKANNLKKRVIEHFRGNTHTGYKSRFAEKIEDVRWTECPNELIALLCEAGEIKKHWPPYNNVMKRVSLNWGVFSYFDQRGFGRFSLGRVGKWDNPVVSFKSHFEARIAVEKLKRRFELCARFCDLAGADSTCEQESGHTCHGACTGKEKPEGYNQRYHQAMDSLKASGETQVIIGKGFTGGQKSVVLLEKGRYKGHGVIEQTAQIESADALKPQLTTAYDDQDMQAIIRSYLLRTPKAEIMVLS